MTSVKTENKQLLGEKINECISRACLANEFMSAHKLKMIRDKYIGEIPRPFTAMVDRSILTHKMISNVALLAAELEEFLLAHDLTELQTELYFSGENAEELVDCPICLEKHPVKHTEYNYTCKHTMCLACAEQVKERKPCCPICRAVWFKADYKNSGSMKRVEYSDVY